MTAEIIAGTSQLRSKHTDLRGLLMCKSVNSRIGGRCRPKMAEDALQCLSFNEELRLEAIALRPPPSAANTLEPGVRALLRFGDLLSCNQPLNEAP